MQKDSSNDNLWELKYKKLLNKDNVLDKLILELVENGELKVGAVNLGEEKKDSLKKYSRELIHHRGKYTS